MRITNLIFLLLISLQISGQKATTIHELLNLSKGCDYFKKAAAKEEVEKEKVRSEAVGVPLPPPRPSQIPKPIAEMEKFDISKYASPIKAHFKKINQHPLISNNGLTFFQSKDYRWGVKGKKGKILIKPTFDYVETDTAFTGFVALKDGLFKYYDDTGKPILEKGFNRVKMDKSQMLIVETQAGTGLMDVTGKMLISPVYKSIRLFNKWEDSIYFLAKTKDDRTVLVDKNGKQFKLSKDTQVRNILDNQYLITKKNVVNLATDKALFCEEKFTLFWMKEQEVLSVTNEETKITYLTDLQGKLITESTFDQVPNIRKGYGIVKQKTGKKNRYGKDEVKVGLINDKFEWVIEPIYNGLFQRPNDLFQIKVEDGKVGIINLKNEVIVAPDHVQITVLEDKILVAHRRTDSPFSEILDAKTGAVLKSNLPISSISPFAACGDKNRYTAYQFKGSRVVLDENIEPIITEKFNNISRFGEDYLFTEKFGDFYNTYKLFKCDGSQASLNIDGEDHLEFKKIRAVDKTDFLITLMNDKSYFYNITTRKFKEIGHAFKYIRKLASFDSVYGTTILEGDKQGLITREGIELLPPIFERVDWGNWQNGTFPYFYDKKHAGLITSYGDLILTEYESVYHMEYHLYKVKKNGKSGVVNIRNEVIVPTEYKMILFRKEGIKGYTFDKKEVLFNLKGEKLE